MSKEEDNKAVVGRWFYRLLGQLRTSISLVIDEIAAPHLYRHPELVKPDLPATFFASQIPRPAIGIILHIVAAGLLGLLIRSLR